MVISKGSSFPTTRWGKCSVLLDVFGRLSLGGGDATCSVSISSMFRFLLLGRGLLLLSSSILSDESKIFDESMIEVAALLFAGLSVDSDPCFRLVAFARPPFWPAATLMGFLSFTGFFSFAIIRWSARCVNLVGDVEVRR